MEELAHLGGLMSALVSGGEAEPKIPEFECVLLVTGQIVRPKRVLPVFGLQGQQLWGSDVGISLGTVDPALLPDQGLAEGAPATARFNFMDPTRQHMEGGRFIKSFGQKKTAKRPIKVGGRIQQDLSLEEVEEDDDDDDSDYVPKGKIRVAESSRQIRRK